MWPGAAFVVDRDPDETPRISNRNQCAYNLTGRDPVRWPSLGHVTDHTTHNRPGAPTMAV